VFEVAEGALASPNSSLLMGGNPTRGTGYFANSHKHNRGDYTCLHFKSSDSPLVATGYREGLVRKFGEGSNVVRVRADGDFPKADDDTLIALDLVEAAIQRERNPEGGQRRLGIDVARYGDDRTVFLLRAGPNVEKVRIEGKRDTMEVVGIAVQLIKQWKAQMVCVDTIGIGAGVYDRLVELRKELDGSGNPRLHPSCSWWPSTSLRRPRSDKVLPRCLSVPSWKTPVRQAWWDSIPTQYRLTDCERLGRDQQGTYLINPCPYSATKLDRFYAGQRCTSRAPRSRRMCASSFPSHQPRAFHHRRRAPPATTT
jgi:hypothetical protein